MNNPHVSLHIAPEERLTVATQRKRSGQPRRPPHKMVSVLPNLHLLLRVPSFSRWPLKLHFFDEVVYGQWCKHCATAGVAPLRSTLEVVTDFKPAAVEDSVAKANIFEDSLSVDDDAGDLSEVDLSEADINEADINEADISEGSNSEGDDAIKDDQPPGPSWGIHALPLDHLPLATYLEKGQEITTFEREGTCVVCRQYLDHDGGLYAICPAGECEGVGHLDCWSRHLLRQRREDGDDTVVLPMEGQCPECRSAVQWSDMMKELTLRTRGQTEVDRLLRKSRRAAGVTKTKAKAKTKTKTKTKTGTSIKATPKPKEKAKAKVKTKAEAKSPARGKGKAKARSESKATSADEDE